MKVEENIDLLKDVVVKKIFTKNKYGKMYAAKIISEVIGMEVRVEDLEMVHPEVGVNGNVINSESDIVYKSEDNSYINIEINYSEGKYTKVKNMAYVCQLFLRNIRSNKSYNEVNKIIQINIDGYDYYGQNDFIYKAILKEVKYNIPENNLIEIYHINLDRLRKEIYNEIEENELKKMLYIFVCKDEKRLEKMYEGDKLMGQIFNVSKELQEHFDELLYYNKEELERLNREDAKNEGRKEGIQQGTSQRNIEIAKIMLDHHEPLEKISQYTNLTIDDIKQIK